MSLGTTFCMALWLRGQVVNMYRASPADVVNVQCMFCVFLCVLYV